MKNRIQLIVYDKHLIKLFGLYKYSIHEIIKEDSNFYWIKTKEYLNNKIEVIIRLKKNEVKII